MDSKITEGHYARKQLLHPVALIRWSHRARFHRALDLMGDCRDQQVLDYGCGDGTFLALLADRPGAPRQAVGAELGAEVVVGNQRRLAHLKTLEFVLQSSLDTPTHHGRFDRIICMEVFEHMIDPGASFQLFRRLLRPDGRLLISVPVETGPALLVKQAARRLAAWMGARDYPGFPPYSWRQLCHALTSPAQQHMERPINRGPDGFESYSHKGFNWKVLRTHLLQEFEILRIATSPLPWLPPGCNSQVWFIARARH